MVKSLLELFERVIGLAKRTNDPKVVSELKKLGEDLSTLAKDPSKVTAEQISVVANKLDQIDPPNASKGEGVASLDISDDQRQINEIIKRGDSDEPATLAYTEKKINPDDPNYFVKSAEEARIQVEQEAKSLFDNGVFTKEQYLDELAKIKENYGEGSSLYISSQKADGTYEAPSVTNRPQGKSADMYDSAERSIEFVAEKTGLSFEEARLAIMEKINQGYAIGDPKRTLPNDLASIKAYLDNNLSIGSSGDAIEFLEDIEEIAFSGAIDLSSDTAKVVNKTNVMDVLDNPKTFTEIQQERGVGQFADDAPKTLEDTFKNVPPERRAVMEELYAPIIEEQKIIEATQKEIQQTAARIQDLIEQGRVDEAEALAESLRDFQTQLKSTDSALDATIIPPKRTLNAQGGRIGFQDGSDDLPNKKPAERFFGEDAAKKGFPMNRRTFLGGLGVGIASLFIPRGAAKVATTAAKAAPEIAAQGMPNWFPLLVNKIKKQGKQIEFATGGRHPDNVYKIKDGNTEYILTEDAVNGSMDISTRGDDFQQVSFEYIPPTDVVRPGGKIKKEDAEFYAHEFMKGGDDIPDYENTLSTIDDLRLGINSIEEFAKAGNKTPAEKLDEVAAEFKKATTKEEFATGGRVGYKNGGGVGTLFKEKRA